MIYVGWGVRKWSFLYIFFYIYFCFTSIACISLFFNYYFFLSSFFSSFFLSFSLWFIGLLRRFFLFACVFGQTLTNAQFYTNVYKYVKYIAQGCCESVMDIFLNFIYFLRGCIWTQFILIIMHFSNLILFRIKRIDHNIYHIWCVYLLIHIFAIRITWLMARTSLPTVHC